MSGEIRRRVEEFVAGFNDNSLDDVMAFFADDAVYWSDAVHEGKAAIRAAFEPQFNGVYGKMTFDVHDMLVDEGARKATIRWTCHHDIGGDNGADMPLAMRLVIRARFGNQASWEGVDVFHFDEDLNIVGKYSYTNGRPKLA